jgi:hypothetical protein
MTRTGLAIVKQKIAIIDRAKKIYGSQVYDKIYKLMEVSHEKNQNS